MTYNVFGGTLNLAQSISLLSSFSTVRAGHRCQASCWIRLLYSWCDSWSFFTVLCFWSIFSSLYLWLYHVELNSSMYQKLQFQCCILDAGCRGCCVTLFSISIAVTHWPRVCWHDIPCPCQHGPYLYLRGGQHAVQRWGHNQIRPNAQKQHGPYHHNFAITSLQDLGNQRLNKSYFLHTGSIVGVKTFFFTFLTFFHVSVFSLSFLLLKTWHKCARQDNSDGESETDADLLQSVTEVLHLCFFSFNECVLITAVEVFLSTIIAMSD